METAATVIGGLIVVAALAGFVRMLWRQPGNRGNDGGEGMLQGSGSDGGGPDGGGF